MTYRGAVLALLVLGGCGSESHAPGGGIAFSVEEVGRFGSRFEDGSSLTSVTAVTATASEVFILESQPARVAVFGRDGEWLRDVGRSGEGPGEFQGPAAIGLRDGLLWVGDPRGGRVEVFTEAGEHVRSARWSLPADSLGARSVPSAVFSDGSILAGPASLPIGAAFRGAVTHRTYYRATDLGADLVELYVEPVVLTDFASVEVSAGRFLLAAHPHPQAPLVRALPDGSGIVVVERYAATDAGEARFGVRVVDHDGEVRSDWSLPYRPIPAVGWRDRTMEELADEMLAQAGSVDRALLSAIEDGFAELAFYPAVSDAVAGSDGSIWLRREEVGEGTVRWEVLDLDGSYLGNTVFASDLTVLGASRDEVWALERDDLDVPFVVNLRVVW